MGRAPASSRSPRRLFRAAAAAGLLLVGASLGSCGPILRHRGLHPPFEAPPLRLDGARALIVCTSHDRLGPDGDPTGVFGSELTHPYYRFVDAGVEVDLASIAGGPIPIDPFSQRRYVRTEEDARADADPALQRKIRESIPIAEVDPRAYDLVYLAGGWGAAYDLGTSDALGRVVSEARAHGAVLGAVCHGPLGFLRAREPDGTPLVAGKHLTAVTDKQVRELGIEITPMHPETELRRAGALFESATASRDVFANHVVVDGTIVTGQNQNAGAEVAYRMMELRAAAGESPSAAAPPSLDP